MDALALVLLRKTVLPKVYPYQIALLEHHLLPCLVYPLRILFNHFLNVLLWVGMKFLDEIITLTCIKAGSFL